MICSSRGPKVTYSDILYIIFALHGETAIILVFCNPMTSIIWLRETTVEDGTAITMIIPMNLENPGKALQFRYKRSNKISPLDRPHSVQCLN